MDKSDELPFATYNAYGELIPIPEDGIESESLNGIYIYSEEGYALTAGTHAFRLTAEVDGEFYEKLVQVIVEGTAVVRGTMDDSSPTQLFIPDQGEMSFAAAYDYFDCGGNIILETDDHDGTIARFRVLNWIEVDGIALGLVAYIDRENFVWLNPESPEPPA